MGLLNSFKEAFLYFFRGKEDLVFSPLASFSALHLIILFAFIIVVVLISRGNLGLRKDNNRQKLSRIFATMLLLDQIILYTWQFSSGFFNVELSLPLYHCRIAIALLIVGVLFNRKNILYTGMYWGFLGSIMAMLVPDMYKFQFPHYTNFQFFYNHIVMGLLIINLLKSKEIQITAKDTKSVLIITNVYNLSLFIFNLILARFWGFTEINYGYMNSFPKMVPIKFNVFLHFIVINLLFNMVMMLIGYVFQILSKDKSDTLADTLEQDTIGEF